MYRGYTVNKISFARFIVLLRSFNINYLVHVFTVWYIKTINNLKIKLRLSFYFNLYLFPFKNVIFHDISFWNIYKISIVFIPRKESHCIYLQKLIVVQKLCTASKTSKINVLILTRFAKMQILQFLSHIV